MSLAARLPKQVDGAAPVVPLHPHVPRPRVAELDQSVVRPVLDEVRRRLSEATGTAGLTDAALRVRVEAELASVLSDPEFAVAAVDLERVRSGVVNEILGFGLLQDLLDNPEISEIMVNGANNVYVESHGVVSRLPRAFDSDDQLIAVINRMVRLTGRRIDQTSPMVDARLPDGSRLNAVLPPLTVDGPSVTIRKFTANNLTVARLTELGSLSPEAADLLQLAVEQRLNILVSGGTGTGKTTLLNVLSSFIDRDNRVITVEDAVELSLDLPNMIRLETRPANIEGIGQVTIRDLVRNALRMRPDRIVVGEVRGAEALDMLQAMNTGHEGSLSTLHANSPRDALSRLETMVLLGGVDLPLRAIREQIGSAIDLIVQVARDV
ncbi:MAG: CpaF family protein, partial [Actinobacteria bacterium]|nr:CpaF family protein [Actinomycetota bacterium]